MAKPSNKVFMFSNLVLVLCLLLIVSMAKARLFRSSGKIDVTPECTVVTGVQPGETCFDIAQLFKLAADEFNAINPNLNCDKLFVDQWLCVAGTAN